MSRSWRTTRHCHNAGARPALRKHRLCFERLEDRHLLAGVSWIGGATGLWDVPGNWSGNAVPGLAADVSIPAASQATVTIQAGDSESVNSLTVGGNDVLVIGGGSLTTAAGVTNSGAITVDAGCNLTVGGSYSQAAGASLSLPGCGTRLPSPTFSIGRSATRNTEAGRPIITAPTCPTGPRPAPSTPRPLT